MTGDGEDVSPPQKDIVLGPDFTERIHLSLVEAERHRHRREHVLRVKKAVPWMLLVAPLFAWHLFSASPGSVHIVVHGIAWMTYCLDVAVHLDTALLSYLNLQALPTVVGVLLLLLFTAGMLVEPRKQE